MNTFGRAEILEILFRNKAKIFFFPLIVFALTIAALLFLPRKYRSESKLFLQTGRESVGLDPTATMGPASALMQSNRDEEVKSALQVVGSRGVIAQVVDKLGPEFVLNGPVDSDAPPSLVTAKLKEAIGTVVGIIKSIDPISDREEAIIEVEKNLNVHAERASMVIQVQYEAESPKQAQMVLDMLVEVYQAEHLRIHRNKQSGEFLADQRDLLLAQFKQAQDDVKNAKNRFGISSIDGRRQTLETRLQAIELDKTSNLQTLSNSKARQQALRDQLVSLPERETSSQKSMPNEGADLLRKELFTNQAKLMDQKSRLSSTHPLYVATSQQVEEAKRLVDAQENQRKETTDDISPIYRTVALNLKQQESETIGFEARQKVLEAQHVEITQALENFNRNVIELTQLEHAQRIAEDKYLQYSNNLEQARVDEALESGKVSSVSVAQSATFSEKPVSPSKLLVLVGGAFMAFSLVVGTIFLGEKFNDRIRSEVDLSNSLGLPVFAMIEESPMNKRILAR
jgi:polysaccharide biosynthesis protein PslE